MKAQRAKEIRQLAFQLSKEKPELYPSFLKFFIKVYKKDISKSPSKRENWKAYLLTYLKLAWQKRKEQQEKEQSGQMKRNKLASDVNHAIFDELNKRGILNEETKS